MGAPALNDEFWWCDVCEMALNGGQQAYQDHLIGRKHRKHNALAQTNLGAINNGGRLVGIHPRINQEEKTLQTLASPQQVATLQTLASPQGVSPSAEEPPPPVPKKVAPPIRVSPSPRPPVPGAAPLPAVLLTNGTSAVYYTCQAALPTAEVPVYPVMDCPEARAAIAMVPQPWVPYYHTQSMRFWVHNPVDNTSAWWPHGPRVAQ